jgi:hypothetical protein
MDNHNDGVLNNWLNMGARQWYENDTIASPAPNSSASGFLINSHLCGPDGTLEVVLNADQWNGQKGGVVFRWSTSTSYYFVAFQPGNMYSNYLKFIKNSMDANSPSAVTIASNFSINTKCTLKIVMQGSTFDFYLDNVLKGTVTDTSHPDGLIGYGYSGEWNDYIDFYSIKWTETITSPIPQAPANLTLNAVSSEQVNLSWEDNASNENGFSIECREIPLQNDFVEIATVNSNVTNFETKGLKPQTQYVFRVRAFNNSGYSSYAPEVYISTPAPGVKFLIIVSNPLYRTDTVAASVARYKEDIAREGWTSEIITINNVPDPSADRICPDEKSLKQLIRSYYTQGLKGFVLIGSANVIPTAYWRYHEKSDYWGYSNDPSDLYYADMDEWYDLDSNSIYETYYSKWSTTENQWVANEAMPANPSNPNLFPDLLFGRISTDTTVKDLAVEAMDVNKYLDKIHRYRVNGSDLTPDQQRRSLYMINDCYSSGMNTSINLQSATPDVHILGGYTMFFPQMISEELKKGYTHAQIVSHSGSDAHVVNSWLDEKRTWYPFTLEHVKTSGAKVHQINMFACYAAQFNVPNFGAAYLFNTNYTFNVTGSSGGWGTIMDNNYYNDLNEGKPIGEAFNSFLRRADGGRPKGILHGDPLLTYAHPFSNKAPMFTTNLIGLEATAGSPYSLSINAVDPENDPVTIQLSNLPAGATFSGNVLTWVPSAELVGTTDTITARVSDNHNNYIEQKFTIYLSCFRNGTLERTDGWTVDGNGYLGGSASSGYHTPYGISVLPLTTLDSWVAARQSVSVKPLTHYRLSFWSNNQLTANNTGASVRIEELGRSIVIPITSGEDFTYRCSNIFTGNNSTLTITFNSGDNNNTTSGKVYVTLLRLVNTEPVVNGDFENGSNFTVDSWTKEYWRNSTSMNWEQNNGVDGLNCVTIRHDQNNDSRWVQTISGLEPGAYYVMRGFVRGDNIVNVDGGTTGAGFCINDNQLSESLLGSFQWKEVKLRFQAPASGSAVIQCRLGYYGNTTTGEARFDNITVNRE